MPVKIHFGKTAMKVDLNSLSHDETPRKPKDHNKKQNYTVEAIVITYLIVSSVFLVVWKHKTLYAMYLKYIKGQNVGIVNGEIVDLDKREPERKLLIMDELTGRIYQPEEYFYEHRRIQEEREWEIKQSYREREERLRMELYKAKNQRRIDELNAQAEQRLKEHRMREHSQTILCWIDGSGKKIYSNSVPPGKGVKPCP